ncbi:MAG: YqeG family HAD IIIA-type phosphatase [Oscillospiraceae bacterium]|nr:YqeG family HAD IIIA-type phosphatase [Oscillospiraceae bacterium]
MLLLPDLIVGSVCDLTPELLEWHGIDTLLMDFDNTIMAYTEDVPSQDVLSWLESVKNSGICLCIVSNTKRGRAPAFAEKNGIDCITAAKKPFQRGVREAKKRYAGSKKLALVGDQIYTDVLGANIGGVFSILTKPIHLHNIWLRLRNDLEKPWIAWGRRRLRLDET